MKNRDKEVLGNKQYVFYKDLDMVKRERVVKTADQLTEREKGLLYSELLYHWDNSPPEVREMFLNKLKDIPSINENTFTITLVRDWFEGYRTLMRIERDQIEKYMEENNMKYKSLQQLINSTLYNLDNKGVVIWALEKDANEFEFDPNIGRHISDYIRDWFKENENKRKETENKVIDVERSVVQQYQWPKTPDEAVKNNEEI